MSKAQDVINQIKRHYPTDHSFNYTDLLHLLIDSKIDIITKAVHEHSGYSRIEDLGYIYFNDGSVLVVGYGLTAYQAEQETK